MDTPILELIPPVLTTGLVLFTFEKLFEDKGRKGLLEVF